MTGEPRLFGVLYSHGKKKSMLITDTASNAYKILQLLREIENNPEGCAIMERNIAAIALADVPFYPEKLASDNRYGSIQIISISAPERHVAHGKKHFFKLHNRRMAI